MIFLSRFKTIYALRVHCKKQNERKCEICLQAFCKRSALKAHQEQGCERALESPNIDANIEDNKPTFVDCISEPAPCTEPEINLDASFVCEIIPKEPENNDIDNGNEDDIEQNEVADDSNHGTTSADNDSMPSVTYRRRKRNKTKAKTKTKAKKLKRGKQRERYTLYDYENTDDANELSDTKFYCYLCKRR